MEWDQRPMRIRRFASATLERARRKNSSWMTARDSRCEASARSYRMDATAAPTPAWMALPTA